MPSDSLENKPKESKEQSECSEPNLKGMISARPPASEAKVPLREQRIRNLTHLYYSRPEVRKAIFQFSQNREIVPRYFEGFGKRPDSLQYPGDVFQMVKKGATSFHCSEEIWNDPLEIQTGMPAKQLNSLRTGWDLLLDIDSKYLDYSKVLAEIIIKILKFYGIKNIGIKFSGSKGFHIIIPAKAFPEEINGIKTSEMFPEWPRIITQFIMDVSNKELIEKVTHLTKESAGFSKYVRDFEAPKEVVPDLVLVSSRHLFRMPYSLHEKTSLASAVLDADSVGLFHPRDADPLKVKIINFMPESEAGEASELLREALDWHKNRSLEEKKDSPVEFSRTGNVPKGDFTPMKITNLSEDLIPPTIKKILAGVSDGRKRSVFVIINFFRAIGLEKREIESRLEDWNKKNEVPLKEGYIKTQMDWSYRNKIILPPNYDKDYYKGIGIPPTEEELRFKNPVSFVSRKVWLLGQREREATEERKRLEKKAKAKVKKEKKEKKG
ncbi:MAG: hypothetical protein KJ905_02875 [Nanoarchaeota archaeon]|nr:hypothetical protein [Nanoarchaeota archaeon]MBU1501693.1 hypothetical protein [Nanoarchaeota archaeon]